MTEDKRIKFRDRRIDLLDPDEFARRLKHEIQLQELDLHQFEDAGVCSYHTVKYWLDKRTFPTSYVLGRVAAFLGVSCDYLLGISGCREIPPAWMETEWGTIVCPFCGKKGQRDYQFCPHCGTMVSLRKEDIGSVE